MSSQGVSDRNARDLVRMAVTFLLLRQPFFGTLALFLRPVEDPSVPTAGTDGSCLYYNPGWIGELAARRGLDAVAGVVAHEVLHCALGHLWRRGGREKARWNLAADLAVNLLLEEAGVKLPDGALKDRTFRNMPAEEIYARLSLYRVALAPQAWGWHEKWGGQPEGEEHEQEQAPRELEDLWKQRVAGAVQAARLRGNLPGWAEVVVREASRPRVSWRDVMARFLSRARFEYSWLSPDRRFVHAGLYVPGYGGEGVEELVVAVDTSGSISEEELEQFAAEAAGLWAQDVFTMHVVDCDVRTYHWYTLERGDAFPLLRLSGRGGTDFRPVFDEVARRGIQPTALVFLTDGEGLYPDSPPAYPVLWVLCRDATGQPPWGQVVRMG